MYKKTNLVTEYALQGLLLIIISQQTELSLKKLE